MTMHKFAKKAYSKIHIKTYKREINEVAQFKNRKDFVDTNVPANLRVHKLNHSC